MSFLKLYRLLHDAQSVIIVVDVVAELQDTELCKLLA